MPTVERRNIGRLSVTSPTAGCSSEAVTWNTKWRRPIWVKLSA